MLTKCRELVPDKRRDCVTAFLVHGCVVINSIRLTQKGFQFSTVKTFWRCLKVEGCGFLAQVRKISFYFVFFHSLFHLSYVERMIFVKPAS